MYGYVVPDKPNLLMKEYALYRAYYCGVCKAIGKRYGQFPRFTTNYDIAFLAAFAHDFTGFVPEIRQQGCILNPIKKKDIILTSPLMERVAAANLILSYYKLTDDILDKSGYGKRAARAVIQRGYRKAKKDLPGFDAAAKAQYERLRTYEKAREPSIDKLADCFAAMLADAVTAVMETSDERARALGYHLGKWVYLADAVDDLEEDNKRGNFNPLLNRYGGFTTRKEFIAAHRDDLAFLLNTAVGAMADALEKIPDGHSTGLIDNVVFRGLRQKTKELLDSEKKLPPPRI